MQIYDIPNKIILNIFCHLNYKDLYNVSIACKKWQLISNDDFLWKKLCMNYVCYLEPMYQSYRKRFDIIRNMLESRSSLSICYASTNAIGGTFVNNEGYIMQLYINTKHNKKCVVRNISSQFKNGYRDCDNIKYCILEGLQDYDKIVLSYLSKTKFIVFTDNGNILVYDNENLGLINSIKICENIMLVREDIICYFNDYYEEIITNIKNNVYVIKLNINVTIKCINLMNIINNLSEILSIRSTQNYIIIKTIDSLYYFNKIDHNVGNFYDHQSVSISSIDTDINYLIIITNDNKFLVYKDIFDTLELVRIIYVFNSEQNKTKNKDIHFCTHINNGIIYAKLSDNVFIINIKHGNIISTFKHDYDYQPCIIKNNGCYLLIGPRISDAKYCYHLYNYQSPTYKITKVPNISNIPNSNVPNITDFSNITNSNIHNITDFSKIPNVPNITNIPNTLDTKNTYSSCIII